VLWHLGGEPVDTAITVSVLEQVKAAGWLEELKVNGARRWGLTERAVDLLDDSITAAAPGTPGTPGTPEPPEAKPTRRTGRWRTTLSLRRCPSRPMSNSDC